MEQRPEILTDYQQRIISVLVYIDMHFNEPLTLDELARIACFSPFHFHRIFQAFIGESVYAFIKRIRLENAAVHLRSTGLSVTDIAFQSGYETPSAFAKAFRERFGMTPTGFRIKNGKPSCDKQSSQTTEEIMKPEIRFLEDQTVLFVRRTGSYNQAAEGAWKTLMKHTFWRMMTNRSVKFIGISRDDPNFTEDSKLRYDACITVHGDVKPKGEVGVQTLKGGKYAVFLHEGAYEKFNETYDLIFSEWLPRSNYTLRDTPCYELYLNKNPKRTKPENLRTEIFIPVE
ncbi:MAG: AraC family transcriptional regulator [Ignavibacteriae bacterium]|nr:MAG: AraC family transcriptional regulator [Ignavibacteriota bacterium]